MSERHGIGILLRVSRKLSKSEKQKPTKRERLIERLDAKSRKFEKSSCRDKYEHGDFLEAMQHAQSIERETGGLYAAYGCPECGASHVGHVDDGTVFMYGAYTFKREMPMKKSDPADRLEKVITSVPLDKTAAMVTGKGVHFEIDRSKFQNAHSQTPLPMRKPYTKEQRSVVGTEFGRFKVVGVSAESDSVYVVRCACGTYEHRRARSIRNPNNFGDRCCACRKVAYLKKQSLLTGYGVEADERCM